MKFRMLNKWRASIGGYFWIPCPLCGQYFGGHEWKEINLNRPAQIPHPDGAPGHGTAICPDCTKAGKGQFPYPVVFKFELGKED